MAGQVPDNTNPAAWQMGNQPQVTRDGLTNQQEHSAHNTNFLNQTGEQVKTMAHGAADIASGAARGAMGIAQGTAVGAANMAQGAATAVKNTLGMTPDNTSTTTLPTTNTRISTPNTTTHHPNTKI